VATDACSYSRTADLIQVKSSKRRLGLYPEDVRFEDCQLYRGFTTLSASLGGMAQALNEGLLEALTQESSPAVLAQDLRALSTLLAATPYHRLPSGLLTRILQASIGCVPA
jgi:hypothetical protein